MITEKQCEFIIKVLLCHPTPAILEDPEVSLCRRSIKRRYQLIRRQMSFTDVEILVKREWLEAYLSTVEHDAKK